MTHAIIDRVPDDAPCAREIGFSVPDRYNASEIPFQNLDAGRADKVAIQCMRGNVTYGELCVKPHRRATRWHL